MSVLHRTWAKSSQPQPPLSSILIPSSPLSSVDALIQHRVPTKKSHHAALTKSHLIGDHPSGLTKEQTTETMDPTSKTKGLRPYPRQWNVELVGAARLPTKNKEQFKIQNFSPNQSSICDQLRRNISGGRSIDLGVCTVVILHTVG